MSPSPRLTPAQQTALVLLSAGSASAAVAKFVGVHRNTVANWLRSAGFRAALRELLRDRDLAWREQTRSLSRQSLAEVRAALARAAVASAPHAARAIQTQLPPPAPSAAPPVRPTAPRIETKSKPGRNQPCHCGSGRKFKRCCGSTH